jgi:hypothetical protein
VQQFGRIKVSVAATGGAFVIVLFADKDARAAGARDVAADRAVVDREWSVGDKDAAALAGNAVLCDR